MILPFQNSDAQNTSGVELAPVSSPTCFLEPRLILDPEPLDRRCSIRRSFDEGRIGTGHC